jgi:hypothetical protein
MPFSEFSIHNIARSRVERFQRLFGQKVIVCRDAYLVMGETEDECHKFSCAVTFAVQTRPWRLEVDLWRSFVNVTGEFLESLPDRWLD